MTGILNVLAAGGMSPQNTMVAANIATGTNGFSSSPAHGTMTPTTDVHGHTIWILETGASSLTFEINTAADPGKSYFTRLTIWGPGIGTLIFTSASATYSYGGSIADWDWSYTGNFIAGDTYYLRID